MVRPASASAPVVLDASAVLRIIEGSPQAASFEQALALACHLDHPVYDCLHLALVRREAAAVLTADQRLQALAAQVLP